MSRIDQCPSSENHAAPAEGETAPAQPAGRVYWRSLDELAGNAEFKSFLHREFPAYASELLSGSRRQFLKVMGASFALAGAATLPGCRRPDHKILTYHADPEDVVPGKPLYYATAIALPGGGAAGVLARTFEGRPVKIEGNPLHPASKGKSDVRMQGSVLDLYDPDRSPERIEAQRAETEGATTGVTPWDLFVAESGAMASAMDATRGSGLAFLVNKTTSPSRDRLRAKILARWPQARWYAYEPIDNEHALEGSRMAFGDAHRQHVALEHARVVLSLDSDFLGGEDATLTTNRGFANGRYTAGAGSHSAAESRMSRLYVIESGRTLTGGQADHRLPLKPSLIRAAALRIASEILRRTGGSSAMMASVGRLASQQPMDGIDDAWIIAAVNDLVESRGAGAILVGPNMPAEIHAIAHTINAALGNVGPVISYSQIEGDAAESSVASITDLVSDMNSGNLDTVFVLGCNPVYDAPADLGFADAYSSVAHRVHWGTYDETGAASTMHLDAAHFLESWGDVVAWDATYSVIQPMIAPLFDGHTDLEVLATLLQEQESDPYAIVRTTLATRLGEQPDSASFEKRWRRTLHDGLLPGSGGERAAPAVRTNQIAAAMAQARPMGGADIEAVFVPSAGVYDGRYANNGWLQELPDPATKISWDPPALVSVATAKRLGIPTGRHPKSPQYNHARNADITIDGRTVRVPVWVLPGLADDTIILTCGYGRTVAGRIGRGTGIDVYPLRSSGAMRTAGASLGIEPGSGFHLLANTQDHWAMEGRQPVREIDLPAWRRFGDLDWLGDEALQVDQYDNARDLNLAGLMGMESHTPANRSIYSKEQQHHYTEVDADGEPLRDERGHVVPKIGKYGRRSQQWGMSIDLTSCTGCGACTIACQAENNIPIVGKMEVAKGREMHWIRVDRYFASTLEKNDWGVKPEDDPNPDMLVQPVPCMQCENAPCEVVCPVNATVHSPEGLNQMTYNRCIGTRYCSNNCPYKVRRFNYFDYATKEFKGGYGQLAESIRGEVPLPSNQNFVPPRLREPISDVQKMVNNPHVTVRSRGVMEKCTYCTQRINQARIETRLHDLDMIPDGFFETACQQACPSDSIVFGDIYDFESNDGEGSRVSRLRNDPRSFQLLAYLNSRPRTTYAMRIRNPNPALVDEARRKSWEESPGHHGHGSGHDVEHPGSPPNSHDDDHQEHSDAGRILGLPILNNISAGVLA